MPGNMFFQLYETGGGTARRVFSKKAYQAAEATPGPWRDSSNLDTLLELLRPTYL